MKKYDNFCAAFRNLKDVFSYKATNPVSTTLL